MRVALITEQLLAPVPGGIGRYQRELAAALARSATQSDAVTSWTAWHADVDAAKIAGIRGPHRLPASSRVLAAAWVHGVGPTPRGADVVHALSALAPPIKDRPLVVSVHDTIPWTSPETLTPHGARWHRAILQRAIKGAAAIGVLTAAVGDELRAIFPSLAPERVHVLGGGVTPELLAEPSAEHVADVRARLELPERFLLSVSTLEPRKGLDVLIAALGRLGSAAPPLLVVGQPGWGGVDVAAAATAAGLPAGTVRATGRLPDADLAVVLRAAEILIAPSRAEGFGLPIAEAMAVGTPVICSDVPAHIEVAGGAAVLVPRGHEERLAEAIEGLWADSTWRVRLSSAGLEQAVRHRWEAVADRAWSLYQQLYRSVG